jgi:ubiquinone biosynthesis UbiH/UbiF/VisC/COQ6 family hydroxylase
MRVWEREAARGMHFQASDAGRAELGWIVEHGLIVSALWGRLDGVSVFENARIAGADFGEEGASLRLQDGRGLHARLAVAADGGDSQLRALAGIDTVGWSYGQRAIVCHVHTARAHRQTAWQRFLGTGPLAFLPLADGRSSIVWSADSALADELMALPDIAFRERLAQAAQQVLGEVSETTRRIAFPLRLQHARRYSQPGLVLVGDAAHSVHPLAGQGVNLGFADAAQLAATLSEARAAGRGWSSPRTLERYVRARKAANLEMLALTDTLNRAFRSNAPGLHSVLGLGIEAVERLSPLKAWLARQAVGA